MRIKIYITLFISIILFSTSCFKEDEKIAKHKTGDVITKTVEMGQYYTNQIYFDLGTGNSVCSNSKDIWDLAFSMDEESMIIRINGAKDMRAAATNDTSFYSVSDTTNSNWKFDSPTGNTDSLAINLWYSIQGDTIFNHNTFIIDKGMNYVGKHQGILKIKVLGFRNNTYKIQYANLDNSDFYIVEIPKNNAFNYTQLQLKGGNEAIQYEPAKDSWDLLFTRYVDWVPDDDGIKYPYLVTGALLNPNNVFVARDNSLDFDNICLDNIISLDFSSDANAIGYQWKSYNDDDGYTVHPEKIYIIKDTEGFYYKLRFIGFYNEMGEKGFPKFEFQKL